MKKSTWPLLLGIIGIISLILCWAETLSFYTGPRFIDRTLDNFFIRDFPQPFELFTDILYGYMNFAFIFVFPLSILGLVLGIKSWNELNQRKITFFSIFLNSLNLLLSLLIAWFLFGLARGM